MSLLLVGQGRLGTHLRVYFEQAKIPFQIWNRKTHDLPTLKNRASSSTHILLAISDAEIENFYREQITHLPTKTWVHFSGSIEVPGVHSVHPLMTFGPQLYSLERYVSIPLITTSTKKLDSLLPGLKNQCFQINVEWKAKYHALCVLSGNFTTILWQKFISEIKNQNLDPEIARLYAEQTIKNVFDYPESALTGPLARQDRRIQKMNLDALKDDRFAEVYQAFQFAHAEFMEQRRNQ